MTKREKLMLVILAFVAVVALGVTVLLLPLLSTRRAALEHVLELRTQQAEMTKLIENNTLETRLEEQKKLASENSEQFYSVLNTYTIGEVLNKLAQENSLGIRELYIEEYVPLLQEQTAAQTVPPNGTQNALATPLVKAPATMIVTGSYENMLNFLDALHAKSYSLNVSGVQLEKSTENQGAGDMQASFQIDIYGVSVGDSGLIEQEIIQK